MVLCIAWSSASMAAVELEGGLGEIAPGSGMVVLEDERANWTRDEAIAHLDNEGQAWSTRGFPTLGYSDSAFWASISLENHFTSDQSWLVKMKFSGTDRLDFYYQDVQGNWVQKSAGDTLPFEEREIKHHYLIFEFPVLASQSQTIYFRVQSKGSIQLPIYLTSLFDFQLESQKEYFWIGIYYGLICLIALYSLFIWYTSKDKSYLHFLFFLLSGGLFSFSFQGLSYADSTPKCITI